MKKIILFCIILALFAGVYFLAKGKMPWESPDSQYTGTRISEADGLTQVAFFDHPGKPTTEATARESKVGVKGSYVALNVFCCAVNPRFADTWKKEAERLTADTLGEQLQDLAKRKIIKHPTTPHLLVTNGDAAIIQLDRQGASALSLFVITVTPKIQSDGNILMNVTIETQKNKKKVSETTSQCRVKSGGFVIVGAFDFEGASNTLILKADILE